MKKSIISIVAIAWAILSGVSITNADTYFRAGAGPSIMQDQELSTMNTDLGVRSNNPGINLNGALGYKPHHKNKSGFFGEIESGYSKGKGNFDITPCGECAALNVSTFMEFVHLMFNVGYEHVLPFSVGENTPIKLAFYAGAGPVFSEIHGDIQQGDIQLDNMEGDTALGYQAGAHIWVPLLSDLELGLGAKYSNSGEHRTMPGVTYQNNKVDLTAQARFWF